MAKAKGGWIQKAVKQETKGALRKTAQRHGALKNGIDKGWLKKAAAGVGVSKKTTKRAQLAVTLGKLRKKGK